MLPQAIPSEEEAREKQFELLNQGEDVLHILPYDGGTGQMSYLVAYRFFDDESLSLDMLDAINNRSEEKVNYLMLSLNGPKLYQVGI